MSSAGLLKAILLCSAFAAAGQGQIPEPESTLRADEIVVYPVQGDVYLLASAAANTTVQVGGDSIVVVDTQPQALHARLLEAIRRLSNKPIRYLINTTFDLDHTGGNLEIAGAGSALSGGFALITKDEVLGANVIAHNKVLQRMSLPPKGVEARPFKAWPTETFENGTELFNGEAIQVFHAPAARTDGDSIVFFRRSDVVSAGDVFSTVSYPVIDVAAGGTINGMIAALNHILDLTIPKHGEEGGTYVIPGHGRICDEGDVVEYRDMVTIIRDRIQDSIKKGMTLEQVKKTKPTFDYEPRYGSVTGSWTTDNFIEAVYKTVPRT